MIKGKVMERSRKKEGFTLIELLMVMAIIGLLAAMVAPKFIGKVSGAKQQAALAQIELLGDALELYRLDVGKYPTSEYGLEALREPPEDAVNWDGAYLKKDIPLDPWRTPYVYRCPGDHGEYDIISYGADGEEGGEKEDADITSWGGISLDK